MSGRVPPDASLERLLGLLEAHNPNLMKLVDARTEKEFVDATEGQLERAVRAIESGARQYAVLDERGLSQLLADFLNQAGFKATAETNVRGHVDVVVQHSLGGEWKYLGECKMHQGFKYHLNGCGQLLGYCTGRELRAFCLDFFAVAGMFDKLKKLRNRMDIELPMAQSAASANHAINGAFLTIHLHLSGRNVEILHLGCSVWTGAARQPRAPRASGPRPTRRAPQRVSRVV